MASHVLAIHMSCSNPMSSTRSPLFGGLLTRKVSSMTATRRQQRCMMVMAAAKEVLVVNTNSGGHAVIGFWLAKELQTAGHQVTIFTVGDEASDKMKKPPFSRFSELRELGVKTVWGDPKDLGAALGSSSFTTVLDNNGKDMDTVKPVADWAKAQGAEQFLFVSSAGIYKTSDEPPHVEGDSVKADAGHVLVEDYIKGSSFESSRAGALVLPKECIPVDIEIISDN